MAPAAIHDMNDFVAALQQLTKNDSKAIKKAEKMLKTFLKNPANAPFLIVVLRNTAGDSAVRHHAALLLKKKVEKFFPNYPMQQQHELKTELLQLLVNEPESSVATGKFILETTTGIVLTCRVFSSCRCRGSCCKGCVCQEAAVG